MLAFEELQEEETPEEEEPSSPEDNPPPTIPRSQEDVTQDEDVDMEDVQDIQDPPHNTSLETDSITEEVEEQLWVVGGATPVTPAEDQILGGGNNEEDLFTTITPSLVVAES